MSILHFLILLPLLVFTYYDLKTKTIPLKPAVIVVILISVWNLCFLLFGKAIDKQIALHNVEMSLLVSSLLTIVYFLTKQKAFGEGDIIIISLICLSAGLGKTLVSIAIASWTGSLYALYYYLRFKKFKGVQIPLIPFLTAGYIISTLIL